ncbi:hypothetical protein SDC9_108804 [bioreactor metagenome]|uniref:Uncharacterized protein n=1 Tax=bioreactor metagenome TaxID=1076179 RepID=A0A645B906_9ZZZZ
MDMFLDGEYYATDGVNKVYHAGWCADVARYATRISNLNTFKPSGIYSFTSGANGAPCSYGILIHGAWNEYIGAPESGSDFSQIVIDLGTGIYRRSWVNGGWSGWRTI